MVELLTRAFPEALIFYNRGDRRLKFDVNNMLLLPRSVGPGGERRRSSPALPHEQNTEEDPPQEEQKEVAGRRKNKG